MVGDSEVDYGLIGELMGKATAGLTVYGIIKFGKYLAGTDSTPIDWAIEAGFATVGAKVGGTIVRHLFEFIGYMGDRLEDLTGTSGASFLSYMFERKEGEEHGRESTLRAYPR